MHTNLFAEICKDLLEFATNFKNLEECARICKKLQGFAKSSKPKGMRKVCLYKRTRSDLQGLVYKNVEANSRIWKDLLVFQGKRYAQSLRIQTDWLRSARICQYFQVISRIWKDLQGFVRICKDMQGFLKEKVCAGHVHRNGFAEVCKGLSELASDFKDWEGSARICKDF